MIKEVSFSGTTYAELPHKFEAGTPNIAGVIAFKYAIDFITELGVETIAKYEDELLQYATSEILKIEGVKIFGTTKNKSGIISFNIDGLHPYDIGMIVDKMGVAIRTGHHCTQPIMQKFNIPGTARISLAVYNTKAEVDVCINAIKKAKQMLS
jgi:cysteine desulfurase/selenocysteine lyase